MKEVQQEVSKDTRIVYGASCSWWDSVEKVGNTSNHPAHKVSQNVVLVRPGGGKIQGSKVDLPCCPGCGSMLFEIENIDKWWNSVERFENNGHPGYRKFVEWGRGKCFKDSDAALAAYNAETGSNLVTR